LLKKTTMVRWNATV